MTKLQCRNKYPNCLSLELITNPPELDDSLEIIDIYANLKFNEQTTDINQGKVSFGIKNGCFKIVINEAEFSWLNEELANLEHKNSREASWHFSSQLADSILVKSLNYVKIATIKVTNKPYSIASKFIVDKGDIFFTEIEGLWKHDITPNKHGILCIKLADYLLSNELSNCLSWCDLDLKDENSNIFEKDCLEQLEKLIEKIYQATTDNFLELTQLAGLNIKQDLYGANLMASELKGLDLSGANLRGVNLRGTDLTDSDLSEAQLSYAKLSGADLSGAYLGNANLLAANLRAASLALANLSGADLSYGNLFEANLINTNLSGAKVTGTNFGNNPGLTEDTKNALIQRGAIFKD